MQRDILLVDDEQALLDCMERCFRGSLNVFTARSGHRGLELIGDRLDPFPVVVADLRMPGMDGLEFIEAAREESPRTQFLVLTGRVPGSTVSESVDCGRTSALLTKPCASPQLRSAVAHAIQRYEAVPRDQACENSRPGQLAPEDVLGYSEAVPRVSQRSPDFYMLEPRICLSVAGIEWVDMAAAAAALFAVPDSIRHSRRATD